MGYQPAKRSTGASSQRTARCRAGGSKIAGIPLARILRNLTSGTKSVEFLQYQILQHLPPLVRCDEIALILLEMPYGEKVLRF